MTDPAPPAPAPGVEPPANPPAPAPAPPPAPPGPAPPPAPAPPVPSAPAPPNPTEDVAALRQRAEQAEARATALLGERDTARTERETASTEAGTARQRAEQAEARLLRINVAREAGLDLGLADRLQGADEATLKADAQTLLRYGGGARPDFGGGAQPPAPAPTSPEDAHALLLAGLLSGAQPTPQS